MRYYQQFGRTAPLFEDALRPVHGWSGPDFGVLGLSVQALESIIGTLQRKAEAEVEEALAERDIGPFCVLGGLGVLVLILGAWYFGRRQDDLLASVHRGLRLGRLVSDGQTALGGVAYRNERYQWRTPGEPHSCRGLGRHLADSPLEGDDLFRHSPGLPNRFDSSRQADSVKDRPGGRLNPRPTSHFPTTSPLSPITGWSTKDPQINNWSLPHKDLPRPFGTRISRRPNPVGKLRSWRGSVLDAASCGFRKREDQKFQHIESGRPSR
jgi:hypothetical protein